MHRAGEPPLEYLTRHGWTVTVYAGLYRAHKGKGPASRLVDGPTAKRLALILGWYP